MPQKTEKISVFIFFAIIKRKLYANQLKLIDLRQPLNQPTAEAFAFVKVAEGAA